MLQSADNSAGVRSTSPASNPNSYNPVKTTTAPIEQATIGRSLIIKGEITGSEALYIDGRIEGKIMLADHRVTIGRNGSVQADIVAREVVVMGKVTGNIECTDRVDIRSEGVVNGKTRYRVCTGHFAKTKAAREFQPTLVEKGINQSFVQMLPK